LLGSLLNATNKPYHELFIMGVKLDILEVVKAFPSTIANYAFR